MTKRKTAPVHLRTPEKVTPTDPDYKPQTRQEAIRQVMAATIREIHTTEEADVGRPAGQPATTTKDLAGQPASTTNQWPASTTMPWPASTTEGRRGNEFAKVCVRLNKGIANKINDFCYSRKIEKQVFFEALAGQFFATLAGQPATEYAEILAGQPAHDDMMIFKTHEDIIMRYERYTNRPWNHHDDEIGSKFNSVDVRLIEAAMIFTIANKLGSSNAFQQIKSFKYFVSEIEYIVDSCQRGVFQNIAEYHAYALDVWERRIKPLRDQKWKIK